MVTTYSTWFFHQIGLPDIAWYSVSVTTHAPTPKAMALAMSALRPGVRRRLLRAKRK
jgi:hypothetical protein